MKQLNVKQKIFCSIILGLFCTMVSFAQGSYDIVGVVTSDDGMPLPGVNVLVVGTTNGAATDFDGNYSINASSGDTLEFNYIGFATKTISVNGRSNINITLAQDTESLADVVVVGYGTRKKSHLTGAIAKIGGGDLAELQVASVDQALAGKLAGVQIQNTSSEPGAPQTIRVRASGSITGGSSPLIVVDGFPISGDLSTVNPGDIESVEVLKDASSAAIYGNRAANGVILVTTKKGKSGKTQFSFNSYLSVSSVALDDDIYPSLSEWIGQYDGVSAASLGLTGDDAEIYRIRSEAYNMIVDEGLDTNWQDETFQNGITTNFDFSARGGSEKTKYFASIGYQDAEGVVKESDYKRYNARLNLDFQASDKVKMGISVNGISSERTIFPIELHDALRTQSIIPTTHTEESIAVAEFIRDELTSAGISTRSDANVDELSVGDAAHERHFDRGNGIGLSGDNSSYAKIKYRNETQDILFGNANGYFSYEFIDGLTFKTSLGADAELTNDYRDVQIGGDSSNNDTGVRLEETLETSWLSENTLNFSKEINAKHDIDLLLGFSLNSNKTEGIDAEGEVYNDQSSTAISNTQSQTVSNSSTKIARKSFFARANYAFDDRYLVSMSIRRDGDSRFGADNKWGTFPAGSIGWNVHNESFFEPLADVVSNFKLRASYGRLGSTAGTGAYQSLALIDTDTSISFGDQVETVFTASGLENVNLSWQITEEQDYGLDLGLLNNKIRIGFDYFISTTIDMLFEKPISSITGFNEIDINQGEIESKGLEFELSATAIATDDFRWNVSGNISTVETDVISMGDQTEIIETPDSSRPVEFRTTVGRGIAEFWGYRTVSEISSDQLKEPYYPIGVKAGDVIVEDVNNDGQIDDDDKVFLGSNTPDFTWGFSSDMKYKDFDFTFVLQGSHGAEIANIDPFYYETKWKGQDYIDSFDQTFIAEKSATDYVIQDASFVALRNITLGYTLSSEKVNALTQIGLQSIRLYAAATNLLYVTSDDYTSFNPEGVNRSDDNPITFGLQRGATPIARSFTMGLNVNF